MNIEKLPMYNIKHYQRKYLIDKGLKDTLFDENNLLDIEKLLANLRRSYIDSELFNDEFYIYDGKDNLNKQQIIFLQKMATDLNLNYAMRKNYLGEQFHCLYNRPMTVKIKADDKALIEIHKEDYTNIANIIRQYINPADIKDQTVYNSLQNFLNLDVDFLSDDLNKAINNFKNLKKEDWIKKQEMEFYIFILKQQLLYKKLWKKWKKRN